MKNLQAVIGGLQRLLPELRARYPFRGMGVFVANPNRTGAFGSGVASSIHATAGRVSFAW